MNNQQKTLTDVALQNKWVFYLAVFIFVMISGAAIFRILTPQQTIPETNFATTNYDETQSNFEGITYVGPELDFPNQLSLANIQPQTTTTQEFLNSVIEAFDLTASPQVEGFWEGPSHYLTRQENGKFTLSEKSNPVADERGMNAKTAIDVAQKFITDTFPNSNISVVESAIVFQQGDFETEDTTASNAHSAKVPFTYSLDSIPVFYQYDNNFPFEVTVLQSGEVRSVEFFPGFISLSPAQDLSRISIDQALKNLNEQNLGSIIQAHTGGNTYVITLNSIQSGEMDSVTLEYRLDPQLNQAVPYYRFSGEVVGENGNTAVVQIITPAIRVSNSKP